jgi:hypothetical protein
MTNDDTTNDDTTHDDGGALVVLVTALAELTGFEYLTMLAMVEAVLDE